MKERLGGEDEASRARLGRRNHATVPSSTVMPAAATENVGVETRQKSTLIHASKCSDNAEPQSHQRLIIYCHSLDEVVVAMGIWLCG